MALLHFTFGPVQGFVAQARRTRDLWAGSYLLSYLAGCAMKALEDESRAKSYKDKVIIFPDVENDPLYQAIKRGRLSGKNDLAAEVGSLPNRFKAIVPADIDGKVCAKAVKKKWDDIAQAVKQELARVLGAASLDKINDDMWCRQIDHHWDCAWVISDDDSALDVRKNLRNHHTPPELGEKCTVCGERQELSGKGLGTKESRDAMRDWWNDLRTQLRTIKRATLFDVKQGERLCAVCLVKRAFVFPFISEQQQVIGWKVPVNYPSTSYLAAVDWIIRVFEECRDQSVLGRVHNFVQAAEDAKVWFSERATIIKGIEEAAASVPALAIKVEVTSDAGRKRNVPLWEAFAGLDGDAFFKSAIENEKEFEVEEVPGTLGERRKKLVEALKLLEDALPAKFGQSRKATPFYALLLMDGDNMGKLLSTCKDKKEQENISNALGQFTDWVPDIVKGCNGQLIYAGGDDVFALLPLDKAIECARCCRERYIEAFKNEADFVAEHKATISAAIEYAHMQTALGVVVKDAHRLLDEVAKDGCGRDGLACRVWKRGGPMLTWALPWEFALAVQDISTGTLPDEIKWRFQDESNNPSQFSSKFFYKLGELFELPPAKMSEQEQIDLLAAEYLANRELDWKDIEESKKPVEAKKRVERLLALCREQRRKADEGKITYEPGKIRNDGALLVRFLSQKGWNDEHR